MKIVENMLLEGERAGFQSKYTRFVGCRFANGESPLKESRNIEVIHCSFEWKYPLWYINHVYVENTTFHEMGRSGIWYTNNITINNSELIAPKLFRRSSFIELNQVTFHNAEETLWNCNNIKMNHVVAKGDYLLMNSTDVEINDLKLDGNYVFDGGKNIRITNSILNSKDSFWNCENAVIENCTIIGEYIGWNSKNLTFINCHIESNQGFCYCENLRLVNCEVVNTDLAFEYSTVDATITTKVDSIKNPISGRIVCAGYGELITDDCDISKTEIIVK